MLKSFAPATKDTMPVKFGTDWKWVPAYGVDGEMEPEPQPWWKFTKGADERWSAQCIKDPRLVCQFCDTAWKPNEEYCHECGFDPVDDLEESANYAAAIELYLATNRHG